MRMTFALCAILFAFAVVPAICQTASSQDPVTAKPLTWDVVSIKPHKQLDNSSSMQWTSDGIEFRNETLHGLFLNAFEVRSENQITGYPAWVNSEHFDIQAKMDAETTAAYRNLKGDEGGRQWRAFMRQILDERFAMKFHIEKRELPRCKSRQASNSSPRKRRSM